MGERRFHRLAKVIHRKNPTEHPFSPSDDVNSHSTFASLILLHFKALAVLATHGIVHRTFPIQTVLALRMDSRYKHAN